jgi:ferrous iron transport protein A
MFGQQGLSHHVGHEPLTMSSPPVKGFPLMMADEGAHLRIVALHGGKGLTTRLTELGLNVGSEVRVLQRQGGGLLVARGESRIALGGGMAAKIQVAPLG